MIKGIHHVALVVESMDTVLPYYCAAAELRRMTDADALAISPKHVELDNLNVASFDQRLLAGPNAYLKILSKPRSAAGKSGVNPINQPGIRHFCVQNHDCAILESAVHDNGGTLIAPPLDLGTGNQYAYARDPEGNIMEIEGLPYAPADEPTWLGHVAIVTQDMGVAVGFYAGLFGTKLKSRGRFGPGPQFDRMGGLVDARLEGAWLPAGNMQLELWQFHAPDYLGGKGARDLFDPGYSYIGLETDNLDEDAMRLTELGGQQVSGVAENDRARTVFATDPEGNVIMLLELKASDRTLSIAALETPDIVGRVEAGR